MCVCVRVCGWTTVVHGGSVGLRCAACKCRMTIIRISQKIARTNRTSNGSRKRLQIVSLLTNICVKFLAIPRYLLL